MSGNFSRRLGYHVSVKCSVPLGYLSQFLVISSISSLSSLSSLSRSCDTSIFRRPCVLEYFGALGDYVTLEYFGALCVHVMLQYQGTVGVHVTPKYFRALGVHVIPKCGSGPSDVGVNRTHRTHDMRLGRK